LPKSSPLSARKLLIAAALVLPGCGGGDRTAPPPSPAARAKPAELVYMSRNSWDAVPEDITVYADGRVDYRQLLHTKLNMKVRTLRLAPAALADLRALVARTRLKGADRPGAEQPRDGFRYLLRIGGRSISTVDGALAPGVRPLVRRLARLQDRLLLGGE
jgi:hypothetical protein